MSDWKILLAFKLIHGILPDFVIYARGARLSKLLQFTDSLRLEGVEAFVDIKGLGIGESSDYISFRAKRGQLKPIDRRAVNVHKAYCKAAKDLDSKCHHNPDDEICPVNSAFLSFSPVAGKYEGTVLGLGIGCFGELAAGFKWRLHVHRAQSCGIPRGSQRRQVAQGGPEHVPLKDPLRVESCGRFRLEQPHLGSQPQARWPAVTRRLRHVCGWRLRS